MNRLARRATLCWGVVILVLTLWPAPETRTTPGLCFLCGERGLADGLLNLGLFGPLGIGARLAGLPALLVAVLGTGLSGFVEAAQFFTPGRDASLGDVLFNGLGAWLGGLVAPRLAGLWRPAPRIRHRLHSAWGLALIVAMCALGWLLQPRVPAGPLELDDRPPAPGGGFFEGTVLSVRIDGAAARASDQVRWRAGDADAAERLEVRFTTVEPRWAFRPLIGLRETGRASWPILLGPQKEDIVLRLSRAVDPLRLTPTDLRLADALVGASPGDTLTAVAWRVGDRYCLESGARRQCGLGYTVGSGWALLAPTQLADGGTDRWLDAVWLGLLALPLGLWGPRGGAGWLVPALVAASALAVPAALGLPAATVPTLGGLAGGWLMGRWARRLSEPASESGPSVEL